MLPSWVSSWYYQQMLDQTGKGLPGTNTLAYLASWSATKEKSFITLASGHSPEEERERGTGGSQFYPQISNYGNLCTGWSIEITVCTQRAQL